MLKKKIFKLIILILTCAMYLMLTGAGFGMSKLLVNGKLIELDDGISAARTAGKSASESEQEDNSLNATSTPVPTAKPTPVITEIPVQILDIRIEGKKLSYHGYPCADTEVLMERLKRNYSKKAKVVLTDAYADYYVYTEISELLKKNGIEYSEVREQ